jgi:hypothetical protein
LRRVVILRVVAWLNRRNCLLARVGTAHRRRLYKINKMRHEEIYESMFEDKSNSQHWQRPGNWKGCRFVEDCIGRLDKNSWFGMLGVFA